MCRVLQKIVTGFPSINSTSMVHECIGHDFADRQGDNTNNNNGKQGPLNRVGGLRPKVMWEASIIFYMPKIA